MARSVYVDSSAWIAVVDAREKAHKIAGDQFKELLKGSITLVTSDLVLAETQILLRRRISAEAANVFLDSTNHSPSIQIVFVDSETEIAAKEILTKFADHDFSLTDACSFALMKASGIRTAFTFDKHFAIAGFRIIPSRP
jgi:predicted nucleic acid-binding protein